MPGPTAGASPRPTAICGGVRRGGFQPSLFPLPYRHKGGSRPSPTEKIVNCQFPRRETASALRFLSEVRRGRAMLAPTISFGGARIFYRIISENLGHPFSKVLFREFFAVAKVKLHAALAVKYGFIPSEVTFAHFAPGRNFTVRRTTSLSQITLLAHRANIVEAHFLWKCAS